MNTISFKRRRGGNTVQLVQHRYDATKGRSRTITLGSCPLDADPEDVLPYIRLRPGVTLSQGQLVEIGVWLQFHGDPVAKRQRREREERITAKARDAMLAELKPAAATDPLSTAITALEAATVAMPELASAVVQDGGDVWTALRPRYLSLQQTWQGFLRGAQTAGVAKRQKRKKGVSAMT
jgi:hypothetical protein